MKALLQRIKSMPRMATGLIAVWAIFLAVSGAAWLVQHIQAAPSAHKPRDIADDIADDPLHEITIIPRWAAHLTPPPPFTWSREKNSTKPWPSFTKISRTDLSHRLVSGGHSILVYHVRIAPQGEKLPSPAQLAKIAYGLASADRLRTRVLFFLPNMDPSLSPWARVEVAKGEPVSVFSNAASLQ